MNKPQIKMIIFECPHCGKMRIGKIWSSGRFECEDCGQQWNIEVSQGNFDVEMAVGSGTVRPYMEQDSASSDKTTGGEDWFGASEKRIA